MRICLFRFEHLLIRASHALARGSERHADLLCGIAFVCSVCARGAGYGALACGLAEACVCVRCRVLLRWPAGRVGAGRVCALGFLVPRTCFVLASPLARTRAGSRVPVGVVRCLMNVRMCCCTFGILRMLAHRS